MAHSQASHCAAFAGKALIRVGRMPAYRVFKPPAASTHAVSPSVHLHSEHTC